MNSEFLDTARKVFEQYKGLGEKAMAQLPDEKLFFQYNSESNSIAVIVKHLHGNMLSRWTDFLTSDGEKEWRQRDAEFENDPLTRKDLMAQWDQGWKCLFDTLDSLKEEDLVKTVFIRGEAHTAQDAIIRQLAHYPYHVGQIIYVGKMIVNADWKSLSIPKNMSAQFNAEKFGKPKS